MWKKLWRIPIQPRIRHFLWRLSTDTLPSPANLRQKRLLIEHRCPFCNSADDSLVHLFFDCDWVVHIWRLARLEPQVTRVRQNHAHLWFRELLHELTNDELQLAAHLLDAIWFLRNQLIHGQVLALPIPSSIVTVAVIRLKDFAHAQQRLKMEHLVTATPPAHIPSATASAFFDAAFDADRNHCHIGGYVTDSSGKWSYGFTMSLHGITTAKYAEGMAAKETLHQLLRNHLNVAHIYGDALSLIHSCNSDDIDLTELGYVIGDIRFLLDQLGIPSLDWIPRTLNIVAHSLAQYGKTQEISFESWTETPAFVHPLFHQ